MLKIKRQVVTIIPQSCYHLGDLPSWALKIKYGIR
jgi:hypothetical protein